MEEDVRDQAQATKAEEKTPDDEFGDASLALENEQ